MDSSCQADVEKIFTAYANSKLLINSEHGLINHSTETRLKKIITESYILSATQTENFIVSSNFQKISRESCPLSYYKLLLLACANLDKGEKTISYDEFERKLKLMLKGFSKESIEINDYVPYFCLSDTLFGALPKHFLNNEGIDALKDVLWMISYKFPTIEYSPLITKVASLILLFCEKHVTFDILSSLIDMNFNIKKEENYKIRFHFKFNYVDNVCITRAFIYSFYDISDSGKEMIKHFQLIQYKMEHLVDDMLFSFFIEYLKPQFIMRLLPLFLHDGLKALFRIGYSILKYVKKDVLSCNNRVKIEELVKAKANEIKDVDEFFCTAYKYNLTRNNNRYEFTVKKETDEICKSESVTEARELIKTYYIPSVTPTLSIIDQIEFIAFWKLLPNQLKIKNLELIYSAEKQGYSLTNLYRLKESYSIDTPILFMIKDTEHNVFGGIVSNLFVNTDKHERPNYIYLFSLFPEVNFYEKFDDEDCFYCGDKRVEIGSGIESAALTFDNNLNKGQSYEYNCFSSCVFGGGNFQIAKFDVYRLI